MNHTMGKTASGLGVVLFGALLLSSCNTLKGTESGVKETAYGVGQTVEGAAVGAEKDLKAVKKSTSKNQMMGDSNHEPAG